jgi:hypothetical protein
MSRPLLVVTITAETFLFLIRSSNPFAGWLGRTVVGPGSMTCSTATSAGPCTFFLRIPAQDDVMLVEHDAVVVGHRIEFAGGVADAIANTAGKGRASVGHFTGDRKMRPLSFHGQASSWRARGCRRVANGGKGRGRECYQCSWPALGHLLGVLPGSHGYLWEIIWSPSRAVGSD